MTREVKPLFAELTELIFESGDRKIILLEGESDIEVFEDWFADENGDIAFYAAGGHGGVTSRVRF